MVWTKDRVLRKISSITRPMVAGTITRRRWLARWLASYWPPHVIAYPAGSLIYTPAAGFVGIDSFRYDVADPFGALAGTDVTINVGSDKLAVQSFGTTITRPELASWTSKATSASDFTTAAAKNS